MPRGWKQAFFHLFTFLHYDLWHHCHESWRVKCENNGACLTVFLKQTLRLGQLLLVVCLRKKKTRTSASKRCKIEDSGLNFSFNFIVMCCLVYKHSQEVYAGKCEGLSYQVRFKHHLQNQSRFKKQEIGIQSCRNQSSTLNQSRMMVRSSLWCPSCGRTILSHKEWAVHLRWVHLLWSTACHSSSSSSWCSRETAPGTW